MAKVIMVQGTMSNAGKTFLCAGLCRIFKQDGYRVAPFKSQNMALNSFITKEGLEMGRAQVMQAEAAGIEPEVYMNPILLKPTSNVGSQVIVNGEVFKNMSAKDYFAYKKELVPEIKSAYNKLKERFDIIVIEGAGSPAEINLKQDDIVNMGMAKMADAPVLLVGDIDRGGVFAQMYGTVELLEPEEKKRIKGLVINKFRGDERILAPGIQMLEDKCGIPVVGVIPYCNVDLDDEDSLTERFQRQEVDLIDIVVIQFPRISNFTDFNALSSLAGVSVRYVNQLSQLGNPDMIILPGSKSTIKDLQWMRQNGLEAAIKKQADQGTLIMGICGGFQMLGKKLTDEYETEGVKEAAGMELLEIETKIQKEKIRTRIVGKLPIFTGFYERLTGTAYEGYEIHMGITTSIKKKEHLLFNVKENVFGTYVHGFFDSAEMRLAIYNLLAVRKGIEERTSAFIPMPQYKEQQYDLLADNVRSHLDMQAIYSSMGITFKGNNIEEILPADIEKRSFEIITEELAGREFPEEHELIIKRVIHTTADFSYADSMYFSKGAVEKALAALRKGACIVSDTTMVQSGIHKKTLHKLGGEAICFIGDDDVAEEARRRGVTRSVVSMEKASKLNQPLIFAIGNAPTALIQLYRMIEEGKIKPELIIGVPVGFVNVVQSKALIQKAGVPVIVANGRKGGSNVAAAICNALLYMIDNER